MNGTAVLVMCADDETASAHESVGANEFNSAVDTEQDARQGRFPHVCKCVCVGSFT